MSVFVLIHGAWHGAFCWDKVVPLLKNAGHVVRAPDLPGHGNDRTPIAAVTLRSYVKRIVEVLDTCPEPAILVGHSMGGVPVTQAAEEHPDKIRALVYLAAFLPNNGQRLGELASADKGSHVPLALIPEPDAPALSVRADAVRAAFYGDCSDEDVARAVPRLRPQALSIFEEPVRTTPERYGKIPRYYIECLQDRALSIETQRAMVAAVPCEVITMPTSHSPFYSAPEALVRHLVGIAGRSGGAT